MVFESNPQFPLKGRGEGGGHVPKLSWICLQRLEHAVIAKGWLAFSSVRMRKFVDPVHKVPLNAPVAAAQLNCLILFFNSS